MTIQTKLLKVIECPKAILGYFLGVSPMHIMNFEKVKQLLDGEMKTYIDVGGNKGDLVKSVNYLFPNTKVYAFEPIPNIFPINDLKNTELFNVGLGERDEVRDFWLVDKWVECSTFNKPLDKFQHHPDFDAIHNSHKIRLPLRRFDNLNIELESPCFLKIDTEGHELQVLKGFGDRLNDVDVIQLEYLFRNYLSEKGTLSEIIKILEDYGFNSMIQVNNRYSILRRESKYLTHCDFIFFRNHDISREEDV